MEFSIETYATLVGHTNDDGKKHNFPTYHVDIDGDHIASEYHEHNLTPEQVADIVSESEAEISAAISRVIAAHVRPHIVSRTRVRVPAEVDLEADGRNGYINFVRTETFDCELALDTFPLSELPPEHDGFSEDGACNYGDDVYFAAEELGLVDNWSGPFTFHIGDWEAYDRYIAARVKNEYGYELRD